MTTAVAASICAVGQFRTLNRPSHGRHPERLSSVGRALPSGPVGRLCYPRRYDSVRTLTQFAARLEDQLDRDALAVKDAIQLAPVLPLTVRGRTA